MQTEPRILKRDLTSSSHRRRRLHRLRHAGFTLVELVIAGTVAVIVVGALTVSLSQIGKGRQVTLRRLDAHMRATTALDAIRRDVASVMRSDDLFNTRLLITDSASMSRVGELDRDELLLFSNRLGAARIGNKYQGEGNEYETQYRIADDELGSALWQRRDPVPDRTPDGGGMSTPLVDGIVAVQLEAYDGESWYPDWDSDLYGLPWAVRATVTAVGQENGKDPFEDARNLVSLRTVISIDRIVPPKVEETEEDKIQNAIDEAEQALEEGGAGGGEGGRPGETPGDGTGGVDLGGAGGPPGGGRPGGGGGGTGGMGIGGPPGGGPPPGGSVGRGGRGGGGFVGRGSRGGNSSGARRGPGGGGAS